LQKSDSHQARSTPGRQPARVAVGGIMVECNDFGGVATDTAAFERTLLRTGDAILDISSGVVAGVVESLIGQAYEPVPLLFGHANSGGPLTAECHEDLKSELISRLEDCGPVDGVLLALHGSSVANGVDDVEGDLIGSVRAVVGAVVPIVVTLDLHACVTAAMLAGSDAIVALETYPHNDYFATGQRAAQMLSDILKGSLKPTMAMAKVPVLTGAVHTSTDGEGVFGDIMRRAKSWEGVGSVVSTSAFLVHPHIDRPEMGSGGLVITNEDMDTAVRLSSDLASEHWRRRREIEPPLVAPAQAVSRGQRTGGGPVVLVEAADCSGGGAAGDSVETLRALVDADVEGVSLVPVVDPAAARVCHQAGLGKQVTLLLGHSVDPRWGEPLSVVGVVEYLGDGGFCYEGGALEGEATMGPCAVLTIGNVTVLISTHGTYDWKDEQFRSVGLDPTIAKFIVAKNPMNHMLAYGSFASEILILDTSGPTPANCLNLDYTRMKRPFFPFDDEIVGLEPTILKSDYSSMSRTNDITTSR
jgi:microcystin degradation protein MlrC